MKGTFALIWDRLLRSSLWIGGSKEARLVWITLLVLKNSEGNVFTSMVGLADAAKLTKDECIKAIEELSQPDPDSYTKDNEGRRIIPIEGGWHIVSHELYRFSTDAKRAFWAEQKAKQRESKKQKEARLTHESRQRRHASALERGDLDEAERIEAEGLPTRREQDFPVSEQPSSNQPQIPEIE